MSDINEVVPTELKNWLEQGRVVLVDVREPMEYKPESIAGSVHFSLSQFNIEKSILPDYQDKKIVIYCRSGKRSMNACIKLKQEDEIIDVWNLKGGIIAWKQANLPVIQYNK